MSRSGAIFVLTMAMPFLIIDAQSVAPEQTFDKVRPYHCVTMCVWCAESESWLSVAIHTAFTARPMATCETSMLDSTEQSPGQHADFPNKASFVFGPSSLFFALNAVRTFFMPRFAVALLFLSKPR